MLERACLLDSTVAFARAGKLAHAETFYRNVTHGRDIDPEPLLARVAEAAMQGDRGAELAVVCQKNGSPRWCADALAQP